MAAAVANAVERDAGITCTLADSLRWYCAQVSASAFPRAERIRVAPVASTHAQLAASTRALVRAWSRVSLPASIE